MPLFFVLDVLLVPHALLPRFGVYRFTSMAIALVQMLIVRRTEPSRWSYVHGYVMSVQVGGFIALMTVALGGFDSSYYAGLNLVIIGVNLLMPWKVIHSAVNAALILAMYVVFNAAAGQASDVNLVANNLFFLCATGILAVSINYVRYRLIQKEFSLLVTLKQARDALWGEMELAKRIQTALLPQKQQTVHGFETAVAMLPAREVGGDYYDIIETAAGDRWIAVGDVAGHGVDSGLIMMMAQSSIMTVIKGMPSAQPIDVLNTANLVLREDIKRLGLEPLHDPHGDPAGGRPHDPRRSPPGRARVPCRRRRRGHLCHARDVAGDHRQDRGLHGGAHRGPRGGRHRPALHGRGDGGQELGG